MDDLRSTTYIEFIIDFFSFYFFYLMYYIFLLKKKVLYFIFNDAYNLCVLDQYFSFDFLTYLLLCNCINASNFLFKVQL